MIKHIIFDFDGVLADVKHIHKQAFLAAVKAITGNNISEEYHDRELCGIPTKEKIKKLGIQDIYEIEEINKFKQDETYERFRTEIKRDKELDETLRELEHQYILSCASNSLRSTLILGLTKLGILHRFHTFIGNDQVNYPKPSPEMYYRCMTETQLWVPQTMIIEDSPTGVEAIRRSGCRGMIVKNRSELTLENIKNAISNQCSNTYGW